jgi:hypothetical protein
MELGLPVGRNVGDGGRLVGESGVAATNPGASAAQENSGGPRVSIAHRYDDVSWWLAAGPAPDSPRSVGPAPDAASQRPVDIGAGVQYELGLDAAVVAVYDYRGSTDRMIDSLPSAAAGQRSDEQLHSASLRLIWRFVTATQARPATPK